MDKEAWHAVVHGVTRSRTWLSDWTELNWIPHVDFYFGHLCFGCHIEKKSLSRPMLRSFPLMFSSESFMVSVLTLKSLVQVSFHDAKMECKWCKIGIQFHFFCIRISFSQHHLLKRLSFPHWVFLASLSNISWPKIYFLMWASEIFESQWSCRENSFEKNYITFWNEAKRIWHVLWISHHSNI